MTVHPDVLIIGGGVIGLTSAYFLARAGVRVEMVDQGDLGHEASWAGAGILPPGSTAADLTPFDRLRSRSIAMFASLSVDLRERTGIDNGYLRCGGLELPGEDEAAAAEEWRGHGVAFEVVDRAAIRRMEPSLAPGPDHAYFIREMAQVRNPRHLKALQAACTSLGVVLHPNCPVHGFVRQGERITAAQTGLGLRPASRFLIATGAWTDDLLTPFGWRPGIQPIRGQIALLDTGASLLQRIICRGKRYLVPRADGKVLAGSTEENVGFDRRPTEAAIAELRLLASELVPALASATLERSWAGLRPGSRDGLPFIGPVPGVTNLFVAAGHFRSGIMLSPGTALAMKELLLEEAPSMPLEAFRLDRREVGG